MQSELSRSRFAQETLEQSTAALAELGEKYTDLTTLLVNSRNLVTTLLKSQKSDTWYLETTLYILITTVIWLIFRRWIYGPLTWFVIWPLKLLFRVVFAVIPSVGVASTTTSLSTPSTSLIVKPSADGGIPRRVINPDEPQYVRVGGGGRGYSYDPSASGSVSQQVGQMAEQSQQQGSAQQSDQAKEPVVRGDGTVLQESDRPRNPKKKMWEEDVESAKYEQVRREGEQVAQQEGQGQQEQGQGHEQEQQGGGRRKRDEL
jgi:protein transport protein SEC20